MSSDLQAGLLSGELLKNIWALGELLPLLDIRASSSFKYPFQYEVSYSFNIQSLPTIIAESQRCEVEQVFAQPIVEKKE